MRRTVAALFLLATACSVSNSPAPPSTAAGGTTEPRPGLCDDYLPGTTAGSLGFDGLTETSGIVVGEDGVLWAHDDSGSEPRIYAMTPDGDALGSLSVDALNVDWEDVALGPGPGGVAYLYVADIGDNLGRRRHVTLYRFPEPHPQDGSVPEPESIDVTYPDGAVDAETLIVDPVSGDAFIVTKVRGWGAIYEVPAPAWGSGSVEATRVGAVFLPLPDAVVTGGDVSADGSVVALRTYGDVRLVPRESGQSIGEALTHRSCSMATVDESQGESVAFDGVSIITVGEGRGAPIHRYERGP
jgi:hypothetical protein